MSWGRSEQHSAGHGQGGLRHGAELDAITAAALQVSVSSRKIASEVDAVAAISEEQAGVAEEVSASVLQANTATEAIAASAKSLSGVAQELHARVSRFKV